MKKNFFEQQVSEAFKNKVFKSVEPELKKNRQAFLRKRFAIWASALSFCLVVLMSWHFYEASNNIPFQKNPDMAMVPTHEIEMYENMDLIEHLDDLQAMDEDSI